MQNTRLIYLPSLGRFAQFKEFRNDHLNAMFKTQDSLVDSLCAQNDIIKDCLMDDLELRDLTILDCFVIFLTWRINCVDDELVLDFGEGFPQHVDLVEWLVAVSDVAKKTPTKTIKMSSYDLKLKLGIPSIVDDFEMHRHFMVYDGDQITKRIELATDLNTVCLLNEINGDRFDSYQQKLSFFKTVNMDDDTLSEINKFSDQVSNLLDKAKLRIVIDNHPVKFTLEVIPILIKYLFGGSGEAFLNNSIYLSKKCGVTYTDFLKLSPNETQYMIDFMQRAEQDDEDEIE